MRCVNLQGTSSVIGGKVKNLNIKKIPKLLVSGSYMV